MTALELRQAMVFAARFEYATQQFLASSSGVISRVPSSLQALGLDADRPLPAGVHPVENSARVREYWADVLPPGTPERDYPKEWCGALYTFCLHRAELGLELFWRGGIASHLHQLAAHELPEPGDLAYFSRYEHHATVEAVDADAGTFDSVDGNQGPGILRHVGRKLAAAAAFYSIKPLIEAKEATHGAGV